MPLSRASDGRAMAYAYEAGLNVLRPPPAARTYAYELSTQVLRPPPAARTYAYERTAALPARRDNGQATAYSYEQTIPADPNQLHYWDADLGQYVPAPAFVYNVDTGMWVQVV